jgi:aspartate kinase
MKKILVQKFGGSSLASTTQIKAVADLVARSSQDHSVIVVCSAMQGETDRFSQLAGQVSSTLEGRDQDLLLSAGEQVSCALLSLALSSLGLKAQSLNGRQAGIRASGVHGDGNITKVDKTKINKLLDAGVIPVVTGFQGVNQLGDLICLGRGGSDLTAVAIAAAFSAQECQIYTDVDGVYTADPHLEPHAERYQYLGFDQMLQIAGSGGQVLQEKAASLASSTKQPTRIMSASCPGSQGTLISDYHQPLSRQVGIVYRQFQQALSVTSKPHECNFLSSVPQKLNLKNPIVLHQGQDNGEVKNVFLHHQSSVTAIEKWLHQFTDFQPNKLTTALCEVSVLGSLLDHNFYRQHVYDVLSNQSVLPCYRHHEHNRLICWFPATKLSVAIQHLHRFFFTNSLSLTSIK